MITSKEYREAKNIVAQYEHQEYEAARKSLGKLELNQPIRWKRARALKFWIHEITDDEVLIRTTESANDPDRDDFWVTYDKLILVE